MFVVFPAFALPVARRVDCVDSNHIGLEAPDNQSKREQ
jgi:hypothetical protein